MYCLIMAGGRGTRFWPRSRGASPKQLIDIISEKTMIQETVARISPLVPPEKIIIVTGRDHAEDLILQVPEIPADNIIIEPFGRNTAPCICLAALKVNAIDPDEDMIVLPADHFISDEEGFLASLRTASAAARQTDSLVTLGIKPTAPETGYGYIKCGEVAGVFDGQTFYRAEKFLEKPDLEKAKQFLSEGGFVWNSGMFIWKVSAALKAIETFLPDIFTRLGTVFKGTSIDETRLKDAFTAIDSISIDYGVMEKASNVITLKGDFGWNDIGSWSAVYDIAPKDADGNACRGRVVSVDAKNTMVYSPKKLVSIVGLDNVCVIESDDALLVCAMDRVQDVKKVVEKLEEQNMGEYL